MRFHAHALATLALATGVGAAGAGCAPGGQMPMSVSVAVTPHQISVQPQGGFAFTATVTGAPVTDVTWAVPETGGGTIDAGGYYTAPSSAGSFHVVAASVVDPSRRGTAVVSVSMAAPAAPAWIDKWLAAVHDLDQLGRELDSGIYAGHHKGRRRSVRPRHRPFGGL